jgi:DNA-binding transcriptional regulator GbsR (MarR family)
MGKSDIEKKILSTFSNVATTLGYSPLHGKIIGVLLVKGKPMSLQQLAKETGYSTSMISLSLDLLEVLGVIRKVKKTADRKLYIELNSDLLECLKNAIILKSRKSIENTLQEFKEMEREINSLGEEEKKSIKQTINILEKQIKRLDKYLELIQNIKLPAYLQRLKTQSSNTSNI